jgi:hypothetical protein
VRREWDLDALIESWTLCEADLELIGAKRGATKLGFCLLLKYFEIEAGSRAGRPMSRRLRWSSWPRR